jgi:hypothetical protein
MPKLTGKCSACGDPLELEVPKAFVGAGLAEALCPACTDLQFLEGGGAILELRHELEGARFPVGKVTITGGALAALGDAGQHAAEFLVRHFRGDWGVYGQCDEIELTTRSVGGDGRRPTIQARSTRATCSTAGIGL